MFIEFNRRSIRLHKYDYSNPGYYFITINTKYSDPIFGTIHNSKIILNENGWVVRNTWDQLPNHYRHIRLDAFIIMPDHFHGIIQILESVRAGLRPAHINEKSQIASERDAFYWAGHRPARTQYPLSEIIRAFKSYSARRINILQNTSGKKIWHRNYYEHIIRDEQELFSIREYIKNNPKNVKAGL
ncbi:MAG: transposase [Patescibacteria group bacterium]|jgi:REP element-mobilizing transposase RayT